MPTSQRWVRFEHAGRTGLGTLDGDTVAVHEGELFAGARPTGERLPLAQVRLLMPVRPGKVLALWNNYLALAAKLGLADPAEPLYFMKAPSSCLDPEASIIAPAGQGKIVFEGELHSLRNVKQDVREMFAGQDCGIKFQGWEDFAEGDVVEAYDLVKVND